jgi:hypothetical protein
MEVQRKCGAPNDEICCSCTYSARTYTPPTFPIGFAWFRLEIKDRGLSALIYNTIKQ